MRNFITLNGFQRLGLIKSVQRGVIAIGAGGTTGTATINTVNPSHTLIYALSAGRTTGNDSPDHAHSHIALTNTTTITATRGASGGNSAETSWEAVEFHPGVLRSVQRGTMFASTTDTVTITGVDPLKSQCSLLGFVSVYTIGDTSVVYMIPYTKLQDRVTVAMYNQIGAGWVTGAYQVAEFHS